MISVEKLEMNKDSAAQSAAASTSEKNDKLPLERQKTKKESTKNKDAKKISKMDK